MALTDKLTAIADAIRAKGGTSELLTLDGMVEAIGAISAGGGGGGPYSDVTLLTTIEAAEDVSAIQIDWRTEWSDYDLIIFRPNVITLSVADWLYLSVNTTTKAKYTSKLAEFSEYYSFSFKKYASSISITNRFSKLVSDWSINSIGETAGEELSYLYLQPYVSTTLIKSGSKIDVLGVKFS